MADLHQSKAGDRSPEEGPHPSLDTASFSPSLRSQQADASQFKIFMPDEMIERFGLKKWAASQVEFNLSGVSPLEFLRQVHNWFSMHSRRSYIQLSQIAKWGERPEFITEVPEGAQPIRVEGRIEESNLKSRAEMERRGVFGVPSHHLACAHAAFLVLTQSDLFEGNLVRSAEGVLSNSSRRGLHELHLSIGRFDIAKMRTDRPRSLVCSSRYLDRLEYPPPAW